MPLPALLLPALGCGLKGATVVGGGLAVNELFGGPSLGEMGGVLKSNIFGHRRKEYDPGSETVSIYEADSKGNKGKFLEKRSVNNDDFGSTGLFADRKAYEERRAADKQNRQAAEQKGVALKQLGERNRISEIVAKSPEEQARIRRDETKINAGAQVDAARVAAEGGVRQQQVASDAQVTVAGVQRASALEQIGEQNKGALSIAELNDARLGRGQEIQERALANQHELGRGGLALQEANMTNNYNLGLYQAELLQERENRNRITEAIEGLTVAGMGLVGGGSRSFRRRGSYANS